MVKKFIGSRQVTNTKMKKGCEDGKILVKFAAVNGGKAEWVKMDLQKYKERLRYEDR